MLLYAAHKKIIGCQLGILNHIKEEEPVVEEEIPEEEPIEEPVEGEIQRHTHDCYLMYLQFQCPLLSQHTFDITEPEPEPQAAPAPPTKTKASGPRRPGKFYFLVTSLQCYSTMH